VTLDIFQVQIIVMTIESLLPKKSLEEPNGGQKMLTKVMENIITTLISELQESAQEQCSVLHLAIELISLTHHGAIKSIYGSTTIRVVD
jgi:hypothetical protein